MKFEEFVQEAKEKLLTPPEGSFTKHDLAKGIGQSVSRKDVHNFIKKGVQDGKVISVGSFPDGKGSVDAYYMMVE